MNSLFKYVLGSKRYTVQCSNPSKSAGRLMVEFPETVYDVRVTENYLYEFSCLALFSKKTLIFLKECGCEVEEKSHSGLPYRLRKTIKKPGLILGLAIALLTVYYQSGTVWDMTITGNERIGVEEIENTLSDAGFRVGKPYKTKDLPAVCNRFILFDNRFSRIAINMSGNAAFVEVTERTSKNDAGNVPSNSGIVALKDCIIERPEVYRGTSLVKSGDIVEKGTVLISPVELGSNEKEYISGALGKIYAYTVEDFAVIVPYKSCAVEYNGETSRKSSFSFLGIKLNSINFFKEKMQNYLCFAESGEVKINDDIVLPLKVKTQKKIGYVPESIYLDEELASQNAYKAMYKKISQDLRDCDILSTEFSSDKTDTEYILYCKVECIRDVAERID